MTLAAGNAALRDFDLRVRSYSVLALACDADGRSQRELAAVLRLDPSQVVALVDDLQQRGLIEREVHPADRRTNVIVATTDGRELYEAAEAAVRAAEQTLHASIPAEDRAVLIRILRSAAFAEPDEDRL